MSAGTVYLKKVRNEVYAYGDYASVAAAEEEYKTGRLYDKEVTVEEWVASGAVARIVNGEIVLGLPADVVREKQEETIRYERYLRLRQCDKMSNMHWEDLTEPQRQEWRDYRHALLDVPQQEGFPWNGDIEKAPWPVEPEC